ncbi:unnamed protein product [Urochloa decumbens]|uniref:AB hydrolase-1 domain-containing protein n=1 Tax=Urochloa decumbens TaxID=240449 RepID=A0ABC8X6V3_9POAL
MRPSPHAMALTTRHSRIASLRSAGPSLVAGTTTMRRWSTWPRAAAGAASSALAAAVFAFLDVLDVVLCLVYALVDSILEESPVGCYCHTRSPPDDDDEVSDTLYARRSAVRDALLGLLRRLLLVVGKTKETRQAPPEKPRWSDCGCKSCVAWRGSGGRLHVVAKEPDKPKEAAGTDSHETTATDNAAVFVHGFTSSSSFWAETVFRESSLLSSSSRLFAVDLLGFGQSPKPADCLYRLRDHVEAIDASLIERQNLRSFHLVAHSMGCIVALALAAKHPTRLKSITLLAPPYFLACEHEASQVALSRLAEKKLWPPLLFGSAVMSWYEHVGRTVCFLVCKHHRLWEWLLTSRKRDVDFRVRDLTKHTHRSAWHTMHNVICGGARLQDRHLEAVQAAGVPVMLVHGLDDAVVPVECTSRHLKAKLPRAELRLMPGCDHATVLLGREKAFAEDLAAFWSRSRD